MALYFARATAEVLVRYLRTTALLLLSYGRATVRVLSSVSHRFNFKQGASGRIIYSHKYLIIKGHERTVRLTWNLNASVEREYSCSRVEV